MKDGRKLPEYIPYTLELADVICARIAQGESVRTICKDKDMPSVPSVFNWLRKHPEFLAQYEKAKEEQADAFAEDILDIADDGTNDWIEKNDPENPGYKVNSEHIQRSKLRVDTRKWIASKLKPKKYGESATIKGDAEHPIATTMSLDEAAKRLLFLLNAAAAKQPK